MEAGTALLPGARREGPSPSGLMGARGRSDSEGRKAHLNEQGLLQISESAGVALTGLDLAAREGANAIRVYFQGFG